jgi:hypothetical protein
VAKETEKSGEEEEAAKMLLQKRFHNAAYWYTSE